MNVDSKAGTNSIHGSAFEFNRLSAYTANTYGNDANDVPKGIYARNQFGYSLGGPIVKNKLFAFFSQEFIRVRSDSNQTEKGRSLIRRFSACCQLTAKLISRSLELARCLVRGRQSPLAN